MNVLLVVMLAGLWIWLLSPGVLWDRKPRSPIASVDSFERFMQHLEPLAKLPSFGPDGAVRAQPARRSAARRRRLIVTRLSAALVAALVIALTFGGWTRWLPAAAALLLGSYLAALAETRRRADLRAPVHRLPTADPAPTPTAEPKHHAREA